MLSLKRRCEAACKGRQSIMTRKREDRPAQPPWRTDVRAARETALAAERACVLILNADSGAL
jgi:hypothetical protein